MDAVDSATRLRAEAALRWIRKPGPDGTAGVLNLCYNALDRHVVAGRSEETALEVVGEQPLQTWSYARLLEEVAALAGALRLLGVTQRSAVPLALAAGSDAVIASLACLRLGAVPHLLPAHLDAATLASSIDELSPAVLLVGGESAWAEALDRATAQVPSVVVRHRADQVGQVEMTEPRDLDWDFVARAGRNDPAPCARVAAHDPAYAVLQVGRCRGEGAGAWTTWGSGELAIAASARAEAAGLSRRDPTVVREKWPEEAALALLAPMVAGSAVRLGVVPSS